MRVLFVILLSVGIAGCTSVKEATGTFVTEAVKDKIVKDVDQLLEKRGLSIKEIKMASDTNNDGKVSKEELVATVKQGTKELVLVEVKEFLDKKVKEHSGEVENTAWNWLMRSICAGAASVVGLWLHTSSKDGKKDQRIAVLEKLLGQDLDGDGRVGKKAT